MIKDHNPILITLKDTMDYNHQSLIESQIYKYFFYYLHVSRSESHIHVEIRQFSFWEESLWNIPQNNIWNEIMK